MAFIVANGQEKPPVSGGGVMESRLVLDSHIVVDRSVVGYGNGSNFVALLGLYAPAAFPLVVCQKGVLSDS